MDLKTNVFESLIPHIANNCCCGISTTLLFAALALASMLGLLAL